MPLCCSFPARQLYCGRTRACTILRVSLRCPVSDPNPSDALVALLKYAQKESDADLHANIMNTMHKTSANTTSYVYNRTGLSIHICDQICTQLQSLHTLEERTIIRISGIVVVPTVTMRTPNGGEGGSSTGAQKGVCDGAAPVIPQPFSLITCHFIISITRRGTYP